MASYVTGLNPLDIVFWCCLSLERNMMMQSETLQ